MTGREFMIYILENHLEDTIIVPDEKFLVNFMSKGEAAEMFGVGLATLHAWIEFGLVPTVTIKGIVYIPRDVKNPKDLVNVGGSHV